MQNTKEVKSSQMELIKKGKKYRLIHINPGFVSDFGHHLTFNKNLNQLVGSDDGDFIVLSNLELDEKFRKDVNALPTFTYSTWGLVRDGNSSKYHTSFYHELLHVAELINIEDPVTRNIFFMYLTDSRHIPLIIDIAKALNIGKNFFLLNLFHIHSEFSQIKNKFGSLSYDLYLNLITTAKIRKKYNISLSVETDILQSEVFDYLNEHLPVMPMYSSRVDEIRKIKEPKKIPKKKPVLTVYLPSVSLDRGCEHVVDVIALTREKNTASLFNFVIRNQYKENERLEKALEKVKDKCEVIIGILPEETYTQLVLAADTILIPYRKNDFYARTSGVYADAVLAGKPVVATRQTWVGQQVLKYKNGVTFEDADINDFHEALLKLHKNYPEYCDNAVNARKDWLKKNNGKAFLQFLKYNSIYNLPSVNDTAITPQDWDLYNLQRIIQYKNCIIDEITKEKEAAIQEKNNVIKTKNQVIEKRDLQIKTQTDALKEKEETIKNQYDTIGNKDCIIRTLEAELANRELQINQHENILKEKEQLIKDQAKTIESKNKVIKARGIRIKKQEDVLMEKEAMMRNQTEILQEEDKLIKGEEEIFEREKGGILKSVKALFRK